MIQIQNIDIHNFSLNGFNYKKVFIAIPVGINAIKIVCGYDSRLEILSVTKVSDLEIDGVVFANSTLCINALKDVLFSKETTYVSSQFKIYNTLSEAQALDPKPENGILFQVRIITDPNNSGYYSFQTSEASGTKFEYPFIKKAAAIESGNDDYASSGQVFTVKEDLQADLDSKADKTYVDDEIHLAKDYTQVIAAEVATERARVNALQTEKINISDIVNNFTSTDANKVASANTVKILNDLVNGITALLTVDDPALDDAQERVNRLKQLIADVDTLEIIDVAGLVEALALKADKTYVDILLNVQSSTNTVTDFNNTIPINTTTIVTVTSLIAGNTYTISTTSTSNLNDGQNVKSLEFYGSNGVVSIISYLTSEAIDWSTGITFNYTPTVDEDLLVRTYRGGTNVTINITHEETTNSTKFDDKLNITDVKDILTSTSTNTPLSANQGRILKGFIDTINGVLGSDDNTLDELQEVVNFIKQNKTDLDTLGIANIAGLVDALALKATNEDLNFKTKDLREIVKGDYFSELRKYYANSTTDDALLASNDFKATPLIPLTNTGTAFISGATKPGGTNGQVQFFDNSKVKISTLTISGSPDIELSSANIPANTAYFATTALISTEAYIIVNGKKHITLSVSEILADNLSLNTSVDGLQTDIAKIDSAIGLFEEEIIDFNNTINFTSTTVVPVVSLIANLEYTINITSNDALNGNGTSPGLELYKDDTSGLSSITSFGVSGVVDYVAGVSYVFTPTENCVLNARTYLGGVDVAFLITHNAFTSQKIKDLEESLGSATTDARLTAIETARKDENSKINFDGYFKDQGYYRPDGTIDAGNTSFERSILIPFTNQDSITFEGSSGGNNINNFDYWDINQNIISGVKFNGTIDRITVSPEREIAPANTAFITINGLKENAKKVILNKRISLKDLSKLSRLHNLEGVKIGFYGNSLIAMNHFPLSAQEVLGFELINRGIGSSGVLSDLGGVAITPDGEYIERLAKFESQSAFEAYLTSVGYTQLATPTWLDYSNNPSNYTLNAGDYFIISSAKGSSQERVNTLPTDLEIVFLGWGTNDALHYDNRGYGSANYGTIDDFGEIDPNNPNYIGGYRDMIAKIEARCPKAIIVTSLAPRMVAEFSGNQRTAFGVLFDDMRDLVKQIADVYGMLLIDFRQSINGRNLEEIADGIHPRISGYDIMGQQLINELPNVTLTKRRFT